MSLRFDVSKVADEKTKCWTTDEHGKVRPTLVLEVLTMMTMRIGMNRITAANADEFAERLLAVQGEDGPAIIDFDAETGWTPRPITAEDVHAHIGLYTNASTMTKTQFRKTLSKAA